MKYHEYNNKIDKFDKYHITTEHNISIILETERCYQGRSQDYWSFGYLVATPRHSMGTSGIGCILKEYTAVNNLLEKHCQQCSVRCVAQPFVESRID